ncbi:MAG: hypothetical protein H0W83_15270, partial [Planctomycetes bacterium]|nr:hypothetical protein [Planctomycetota bacterium]
ARMIQRLEHAGRADQALAVARANAQRAALDPARSAELEVAARFHAMQRWNQLAEALDAKPESALPRDLVLARIDAAESPLLDDGAEHGELRASLAAARTAVRDHQGETAPPLPATAALLRQAARMQGQKAMAGMLPLLQEHPEGEAAATWAGMAVIQGAERNPKAEAVVRAVAGALLAKHMTSDECLRAEPFLDYAILDRGYGEPKQLIDKLAAQAPRGRNAADVFLDSADRAFAAGDSGEAFRLWDLATAAAGDGESPAFERTARTMAAQAHGDVGSADSPWARRQVLDAVALVPDLPTFAAAISCWSEHAFFPVLMQDDLYAPKFIAAFKPARVVVVPSVVHDGAPPVMSREQAMRALIASWTSDDSQRDAPADRAHVAARLRRLGITPPGVVLTDWTAGEVAGGLALAAGRFQGIETIAPPPVGKDRVPGSYDHYVTRDDARTWAAEAYRLLASSGALDREGFAAITLAGAYPFRYWGQPSGNNTYCIDDLAGRDGDGIRVAIVGRLSGDAARSAYQAACSLFLQPDSALLFNTYEPTSRSEFGSYRMAAAAERLRARVTVDVVEGGEANIEAFRARVGPWNRRPLFLINSSGYPTQWSIGGGDGFTDDFPVGEPCAIHIVHSGSAAEPYDADTLAGRAVWGGAFVYMGSISEPYLSAFQRPEYIAPRLAAGASFVGSCRRRLGQYSGSPWRLIAFGDPLFALRQQAAVRKPSSGILVAAGESAVVVPTGNPPCTRETYAEWLSHLRAARWLGDRATALSTVRAIEDAAVLDGAGLAMALEECVIADDAACALRLWSGADSAARGDFAARTYARLSAARAMDVALAADDPVKLIAACERLMTTAAPENFMARWFDKMEASAKRGQALAALRSWLEARCADASALALRKPLSAALGRTIADQLAMKERWTAEDVEDAVSSVTATAAAEDPERLTRLIAEITDACVVKNPGVLDSLMSTVAARFAAGSQARATIDQARGDIVRRRSFHKDWLVLGPLAGDAPEAAW